MTNSEMMTMRRGMRKARRGLLVGLAALVLGAGVATAAGEPLRARLGAQSTRVMRVLGVDEAGRIRLVADGASDGGEALVPLSEAMDLQFVLPDDYRRAQQLAFAGRRGEAVFLLQRIVPALVPYAAVPGSNATAVVRFYFGLLVGEKQWPEALAVAGGLPLGDREADFGPDLVALARALQSAGRMRDVVWVMEHISAEPRAGGADHRVLIKQVADDMRRGGHWAEAQALYETLRGSVEAGADQVRLDLLIAYLDWRRGSALRAGAVVANMVVEPEDDDTAALFALLEGRLRLAQGRVNEALDGLSEALIERDAGGEWRGELTAAIAAAYRARGDAAVADRIETDLNVLHPESSWLGAPNS